MNPSVNCHFPALDSERVEKNSTDVKLQSSRFPPALFVFDGNEGGKLDGGGCAEDVLISKTKEQEAWNPGTPQMHRRFHCRYDVLSMGGLQTVLSCRHRRPCFILILPHRHPQKRDGCRWMSPARTSVRRAIQVNNFLQTQKTQDHDVQVV